MYIPMEDGWMAGRRDTRSGMDSEEKQSETPTDFFSSISSSSSSSSSIEYRIEYRVVIDRSGGSRSSL